MAAPALKAALWRARLVLEHTGWPGALGIALLVLSTAYAALAIAPAIAERDALAQELVGAQERHRTMRGDPQRALEGDEGLQRFYAYFPPLATAADWLERIYGVAERGGLTLSSGEYRLVDDRDARLARYQVTLPLHGSYTQVRAFLARVLDSVPAAALEEVTFRREAVDSTTLEVRVRLTLYLGKPG